MRHARNTLGATFCLVAALALSGCEDAAPAKAAADTAPSPSPIAEYDGPLDAGSYIVPLWGDYQRLPRAVVDVPDGYFTPGGWVIEREADAHGSVSFFTIDYLYPDPCEGRTIADVGRTPRDVAGAIAAQPGHTTTPSQPVTLDGHRGVYLEVTLPADARLVACHDSAHALWRYDSESGTDDFSLDTPGTTSSLWILPVDRRLVVVNLETRPEADPAEREELRDIVESAHFID